MRDTTSFEGRLATLFDAYADGAPVDFDERVLSDVLGAARRGPFGGLFDPRFVRHPWFASVLLAALLIAALVASVFIGAMLVTHRPLPVRPLSIQPTGFMTQQRTGAAAVRLADDRVLIIAGRNSYAGANQSFAEIYDPVLRTFTATGSAEPIDLVGGTATLLRDGRVLDAGGTNDAGQRVDLALLYDPETGSFETLPSMLAPRSGHAAVLLADGRVALIGSVTAPAIEYFDPDTQSFRAGPDDAALRLALPLAFGQNGGRVLVLARDAPLSASAMTLDVATGHVEPFALSVGSGESMRVLSAAQLPGHDIVLVVSGNGSVTSTGDQLLVYDPDTGSLSEPTAIGGLLVAGPTVLADGRALIGEHPVATCGDVFSEVFDPRDGSLDRVGQIGGIGGCVGGPNATVTALEDGSALIAGGYMSSGQDTSAASLVHP